MRDRGAIRRALDGTGAADVKNTDDVGNQALRDLVKLCEECKPLPKGTKSTPEARFYAKARQWVPFLAAKYLESVKR